MTDRTVARLGLVAAVLVAAASLTAMVVVVSSGDRHPVVAVIEVATWTAATVWIPVVAWRRYRHATRAHSSPVATGRSSSVDHPDQDPG